MMAYDPFINYSILFYSRVEYYINRTDLYKHTMFGYYEK